MKERILKILNNEGLSATKFADIIGVQRSSISHIISGRNKPSYDFISKTLEKFPGVNAEWLINGKGNMYKEDLRESTPELFTVKDLKKEEKNIRIEDKNERKDDKETAENTGKFNVKDMVTKVNKIERVIILLSDGKFREYTQSE
jgi:transcriptional regulator with XRE-family HTH domain